MLFSSLTLLSSNGYRPVPPGSLGWHHVIPRDKHEERGQGSLSHWPGIWKSLDLTYRLPALGYAIAEENKLLVYASVTCNQRHS